MVWDSSSCSAPRDPCAMLNGVVSVEWYDHQIVGVILGAAITLLIGTFSLRYQRATRWDEPRRLVYSRFVAAATTFDEAGHSETLARWRSLRASDEKTTEDHAAKVDEFNEANRRLYGVFAELKLLATAPVAEAAQSVIDGITERLEAVEAVFKDASGSESQALRHANAVREERIQRFIDEASRELGVRR